MITGGQIVNDALTVAGVLASLFGVSKTKWFSELLGFVKKEEPVIVSVVESALHSPAAKIFETELQHKVNAVTEELKKSSLAQYAFAVMRGAKKSYDAMSAPEKAAAIRFILSHLPAHVTASESEVEASLKSVETMANDFNSSDVYQQALSFAKTLENVSSGGTSA